MLGFTIANKFCTPQKRPMIDNQRALLHLWFCGIFSRLYTCATKVVDKIQPPLVAEQNMNIPEKIANRAQKKLN